MTASPWAKEKEEEKETSFSEFKLLSSALVTLGEYLSGTGVTHAARGQTPGLGQRAAHRRGAWPGGGPSVGGVAVGGVI